MNGGVLHAAECLSSGQLAAAQAGYSYFGYKSVADLVRAAEHAARKTQNLDDAIVQTFDEQYWTQIPDDTALANRFQCHWRDSPSEYSPLDQ